MINLELLKTSVNNLKKRKSRSGLTIISVFIGVTAIFVLISFGQGLVSFIDEMAQEMGDDKIIVQPKGFGFGPPIATNVILKDKDVNFIEDIAGVKESTGIYFTTAPVEIKDKRKYVYVMGSDIKEHRELINELYNLDIIQGRELEGKEKKEAVFGYSYQKDDKTFPKTLKLRDKVDLNNVTIKVKGFYDEVGNPIDDYNIYLTTEGYEKIFSPTSYSMILIRSAPGIDPSKLAETIQEKLRKERKQSRGNEDFSVETFEEVIASFTSILITLNVILVLIAFISLVVAGVNIANTMYASVLERTKDIGVMKAIGAKNSNILAMFAFESGLLALIGGLLAVSVGTIISLVAGKFIADSGFGILTPSMPLSLYLACIFFSLFIGIVSGAMPAYRASKMKPVDALRYE